MKEMLKLYTTLTENSLVKRTVEDVTKQVTDAVKKAQEQADHIVNALSKSEPDHETAATNAQKLLEAPGPLVDHWRPFIAEAVKLLPDELRPDLSRVAIPLGASAAPPAVAQRPDDFVELAKYESVTNSMQALIDKLHADQQTFEADLARVLDGKVDAGTTYTGLVGRVQTKLDEMRAAVQLRAEEIDEQVVKPLTQKIAEMKKAQGELEHELEQHKKKSKK